MDGWMDGWTNGQMTDGGMCHDILALLTQSIRAKKIVEVQNRLVTADIGTYLERVQIPGTKVY